jgi:hypothetical protein
MKLDEPVLALQGLLTGPIDWASRAPHRFARWSATKPILGWPWFLPSIPVHGPIYLGILPSLINLRVRQGLAVSFEPPSL